MHAITRAATGALALALAAAALTACAPASADSAASDAIELPAAEGATEYPLELVTDYGTTTLEQRPERIVIIGGLHDLEAVLSLDVVPLMANWPTDWSWVAEAGGNRVEHAIDIWSEDGLPFEEILAVEPDVIIAGTYGELEADYDKLADIAPVVAMETYAETESWEVDWKDLTRTIAHALDLSDAGERVIADTDQLVADTAAAHPEWAGTTTSFVINRGEDYGLQVINIAGSSVEDLFSAFGFAPQPNAETLAASDGTVSIEQIELLDAETIVVAQHGGDGPSEIAEEWLETNQLYQTLPAVQSGHVGIIQPEEGGSLPIAWAFSYPNALSIAYIADQLSTVYGEILAP